jgi:N-acetylglucosamine-6-sulfatase
MSWRSLAAGGLVIGIVAVFAVGLVLRGPRTASDAPAAAKPNLVFILTDDLSWNLVNRRFAPHIVALEKRGETFDHYFVADSLCCPSRATIFTGMLPHDTKVVSNTAPLGGYAKFRERRLAGRTFAVALQQRGYVTSMLGKYLNGYGDPAMTGATAPVPPGWSDWHVGNLTGYTEFNYVLNDNGRFERYGGPAGGCGATSAPDDYGVDALGADATAFIRRSRGRPFAVEVATFAPHAPYTPAPRNACDFPGLTEPRDPSFDTGNVNPPAWLGRRAPLSASQLGQIDEDFRRRAQSVEAVDAQVARVESHVPRNTYIVFSSDNGYHLGQHRLTWGKMTAFDTDIRVPLIVAGPGVPKGRVVRQVVQNTDLAPTFVQLAGGTPSPSVDGHSLIPLLHPAGRATPWRTLALVEHRGRRLAGTDPDYEDGRRGGDPTTYEAIRVSRPGGLTHFKGPVEAVYVEYRDPAHEREYYDIARDPFERRNLARSLTAAQRGELHALLAALERCHGASACWGAGMPR